jgi:hypothetical protein
MRPHQTATALRSILQLAVLAVGLPLGVGASHAGSISTPSLSGVYDAAIFGSQPIAIHWLTPGASVIDARLTTIDSSGLTTLAAKATEGRPVVNVFFVDSITGCNGESGGHIVGCAIASSNVFAVESSFAAGASGYVDIAHELGHTLGLSHVSGSNLMNPNLVSTALTSAQVSTILGNTTLLQHDSQGLFIELRPIAVLAAAVPEPQTYAMMLAGLLLVAGAARRVGKR